MKRVLFIFVSLFIMPYMVFAMEADSVFDIGDDVTVSFDGGTTKVGYHVLKESDAGSSTVTLIYDGLIAVYDADGNIPNGGAQVMFQLPGASGTFSTFDGSNAQSVLNNAVNQAGWKIIGSPRLLEATDLNLLAIHKDDDGTYTIPTKYDFLASRNFESAPSILTTDYWTQIADGSDKVYAVTKVGADKNAGISAKIVSYSVDPIISSAKYSLRPVVIVNKEYILCNNTKKTGTITPTENPTEKPVDKPTEKPVENTNTGVEDYLLVLSGIATSFVLVYALLKNKNVFKEI